MSSTTNKSIDSKEEELRPEIPILFPERNPKDLNTDFKQIKEKEGKKEKRSIMYGKIILRGFLKGLAKGALSAAVITLVTGGAGIFAFPVILAIMASFEAIKEAFNYYRFIQQKNDEIDGKKGKIIIYNAVNFLLNVTSVVGTAILNFGISLIPIIKSAVVAILKGIYLLYSGFSTQKLKEYYQTKDVMWFVGIIGGLCGVICGVIFEERIGFGSITNALICGSVGMATGYLCAWLGKENSGSPKKSLDTGITFSLVGGAALAVGLVFAPLSLGLSLGCVTAVMACIALVNLGIVSAETKEAVPFPNNQQPSQIKSGESAEDDFVRAMQKHSSFNNIQRPQINSSKDTLDSFINDNRSFGKRSQKEQKNKYGIAQTNMFVKNQIVRVPPPLQSHKKRMSKKKV